MFCAKCGGETLKSLCLVREQGVCFECREEDAAYWRERSYYLEAKLSELRKVLGSLEDHKYIGEESAQ